MVFPLLLIFIIVFSYTLTCLNKHRHEEKLCDHSGYKESMTSSDPVVAPATADSAAVVPPQSTADEPVEIDDASDYNQYMVTNTLESSVLSSHRNYAADLANTTKGASSRTVKSNLELDNPTYGLRLVPAYVPVSANARTVPSQTEENIRENSKVGNKFGLF